MRPAVRQLVRDRLYMAFVESGIWNFVNVVTGIVLLLVAQSLDASGSAEPAMTVGDFALFVFYLGYATQFTATFGVLMAWFNRPAWPWRA